AGWRAAATILPRCRWAAATRWAAASGSLPHRGRDRVAALRGRRPVVGRRAAGGYRPRAPAPFAVAAACHRRGRRKNLHAWRRHRAAVAASVARRTAVPAAVLVAAGKPSALPAMA